MALVTVALGVVLLVRGYALARVVFALAGALTGWSLGGAVAAWVEPGATWTWLLATGAALLGAWLAYSFYAVGVVLATAMMGFAVGTAVAGALAAEPGGVLLAGLLGGAIAVVLALATNLPRLLLVVLTALAGASTLVAGAVRLLGGEVPVLPTLPGLPAMPDLPALPALPVLTLDPGAWSSLAVLVLAGFGVLVQLRQRGSITPRAAYARR